MLEMILKLFQVFSKNYKHLVFVLIAQTFIIDIKLLLLSSKKQQLNK